MNNIAQIKNKLYALIIMLVVFSSSVFANNIEEEEVAFVTYSGRIVNFNTGEPIVFASVYKIGSNIGTITNGEGDFVLKIPKEINAGEIGVSFIGFQPYTINISDFVNGFISIKLTPTPVPIKEVIVRSENAYDLLKLAKRKIPENYSMAPFMVTAFYREIIMQNKNYVGVAEAVLDVYKSSYINSFDYDRIKVYKGRKSMDVKKMDTVLFKLQGGPKSSFLMDIVKNPSGLLSDEFMGFYNYKFEGVIEVDDRQTYVISFDQKDDLDYSLYSGKIYLDALNLAISGVEFQLSEKGIDKATNEIVRKRPVNMKVDVEGANYLVSYREIEGKWYFNNIHSELRINCKWKKKLFKSKYVTVLEMAVTDMDFDNLARFKNRESAKISDVLLDEVNYFDDSDFWGKYNTIKPEESIVLAISKLNKKIER